MSTDLSQYRDLYIKTSHDLVVSMKAHLEELRTNFQDKNAIAELHRAAHSLKSQSLVMGYTQLGTVNRQLEAFFLEIKENVLHISQEYIDMLTDIITHIEHAIEDIKTSQNEPDLSHDIQMLGKHTKIKI